VSSYLSAIHVLYKVLYEAKYGVRLKQWKAHRNAWLIYCEMSDMKLGMVTLRDGTEHCIYNTIVHYNILQYITVNSSTIHYNTVQYNRVLYSKLQYCTL